MTKLNVKSIKLTAWISICYCILLACYEIYNLFIRDYSIKLILLDQLSGCVILLILSFIVVFMTRILRGVTKHKPVFIPNNHRWLLYSAACLFVEPFIVTWAIAYRHYPPEEEFYWMELILAPILSPKMIQYIIVGLILLMVGYLYKLGAQAAEEQRLTI